MFDTLLAPSGFSLIAARVSSGSPRSGMHRYLPLLLPLSDCDSEVVVFELDGFPISMDEFKATYYRGEMARPKTHPAPANDGR